MFSKVVQYATNATQWIIGYTGIEWGIKLQPININKNSKYQMTNQLTPEQQEQIIPELISRFEKRAKECFQFPSPYIKPLFERTEIASKIKELNKIINDIRGRK